MDENTTPYVRIALAVAIGIMVGAIVSSGDTDDVRALKDRIVQMEEAAVDQAKEFEAAAASQLDALTSAAGEQAAALEARVEELAAQLGNVPEAAQEQAAELAETVEGLAARVTEGTNVDEALKPLNDAVSEDKAAIAEIREQLSALAEKAPDLEGEEAFKALSERVDTLAQQMGNMISAGLNSGNLTPPPVEEKAAPQPSSSPESAPKPAAAASEPGEVGLLLSVGDTGMVGDARVFVSRIDSAQEAVRLMVVGDGPRMLGKGYGPLELANGCAVTLKSITDGMAMIVADCPPE